MKARIHWNQPCKSWTVHTYKGCEWGSHVIVHGSWVTEIKRKNKSNPRGFVVCDREQVEIPELFPTFYYRVMVDPLIYHKGLMLFNKTHGDYLILTPSGAYTLPNGGFEASGLKAN